MIAPSMATISNCRRQHRCQSIQNFLFSLNGLIDQNITAQNQMKRLAKQKGSWGAYVGGISNNLIAMVK